MYKNFVGSHSSVGASLLDFKNFKRDMNLYMSGYDSQMMIENLRQKKEICDAFYFEYDINDENHLTRFFWCDPIALKNYSFFGDVVSADATYNTNMYDMVFVAFTGVDNNKSSVTFAFGLLLHEDITSYVLLFNNFKKAVGHEPYVLLIDQDVAVKAAVETVFTSVVHRFCMWHIMFKVPVKVKLDSSKIDEFRQRFNSIVWSSDITQADFEHSWSCIISDFELHSNNWLQTMFDLRHLWIPVFFRDTHMGGLLRTTSRSESQNSFFSKFVGATSSLVVFMMQFENAIDTQRHNKLKLDYESSTYQPSLKNPFPIEKYCASVFTINVFYDLQDEIYSSLVHVVSDLVKEVDLHIYHIRGIDDKNYVVQHLKKDEEIICSCNKFTSIGLPCSHMFLVIRSLGVHTLLDKYVQSRWIKKSMLKPTFQINGSIYKQSFDMDEKKSLTTQLLSEMHSCINIIEDNVDHMTDLLVVLKEKKEFYGKLLGPDSSSSIRSRSEVFENFPGPVPNQVDVHPPPKTKKKGRPRTKRLKSTVENVISSSSKDKRVCSMCNQAGHNSRTCQK